MQKKGMFRFLLPYLIILGVIVTLFVLVGNGSTHSTEIEAQGYTKLVEVAVDDGYVVNTKGTKEVDDDVYFEITFNKVEVEEGTTVTGFNGTFTLNKIETSKVDVNKDVFAANGLSDKEKATYSFSFIVSIVIHI